MYLNTHYKLNWWDRLYQYHITVCGRGCWYTLLGLLFGLVGSTLLAMLRLKLRSTGTSGIEEGDFLLFGALAYMLLTLIFMLDRVLVHYPRQLPLTCIMWVTYIAAMLVIVFFGPQFIFEAYVLSSLVFISVGPAASEEKWVFIWEIYVIINNTFWLFAFFLLSAPMGTGTPGSRRGLKLSSLRRMFVKNFNRGSVCTFLRRFTVGVLCLLWYLWLDPATRDFLKELVLFSTWFQGLEPETQNLLKDVGALHWQDYKVFYLFSFPGFYLVVALLEADLISLRCAKCILFLLFLMTILWGGHLEREFYTLVWKVLTIPSPFKSACTSIFIFFFILVDKSLSLDAVPHRRAK